MSATGSGVHHEGPDPTSDTGPDVGVQDESARPEHAEQVQAFRVHAAVFVASMIVMFVVNLATNLAAGIAGHWPAWWSVWALVGWSIGIAVHGLVVWLARPAQSRPSSRAAYTAR
jgi:hypothetical protein